MVFDGDDLVGRQRGEDDSLTDNWAYVVDGLDRMKRKERDGLYPRGADGDARRLRVRRRHGRARGPAVLRQRRDRARLPVFFANLGPMLRGGRTRWVLRLPLTPLLALLRPKSYRFRLRPATSR